MEYNIDFQWQFKEGKNNWTLKFKTLYSILMTESFTGHCDENQSVPTFNITGWNTKFDGYGNNHILGIGI